MTSHDFMARRESKSLRGTVIVLIAALCWWVTALNLLAQQSCIPGLPEWEFAETNVMRCGTPGLLVTGTWYRVANVTNLTWKTVTGQGAATRFHHEYQQFDGPDLAPFPCDVCPCTYPTTNYTQVVIDAGLYPPGGCSCDPASLCLDHFGS